MTSTVRIDLTHYPVTLFSALAHEKKAAVYLRESIKLATRAIWNRHQTTCWLRFLNSHWLFPELLKYQPRLASKIFRNYFDISASCEERYTILKTHYSTIIGLGLSPLVFAAAREGVDLCPLESRGDARYRIHLRAVGPLVREGELVFQLVREESLVHSLAFTIMPGRTGLAIGVGCLQGPSTNGLELIRTATRELHGIRPKNLLIRLVRQLGHHLGCGELIMASNRNRISRLTRRGAVVADYDETWNELGALLRNDGNFELPCEDLSEPCWANIPSKKRAEAKRRHAMLTSAIDDIGRQFSRPGAICRPGPVRTFV